VCIFVYFRVFLSCVVLSFVLFCQREIDGDGKRVCEGNVLLGAVKREDRLCVGVWLCGCVWLCVAVCWFVALCWCVMFGCVLVCDCWCFFISFSGKLMDMERGVRRGCAVGSSEARRWVVCWCLAVCWCVAVLETFCMCFFVFLSFCVYFIFVIF
jgi:hypothetical protein